MAKFNDIKFSVNVAEFKINIIDPLVKLGTSEGLATFRFKDDGIYISEKDSKNVMYVMFDIGKDMIEGYEYNNEEEKIDVSFNVLIMAQRLTGVAEKADFIIDFDKMRINIKAGAYKFIIGMKNRKYNYFSTNLKYDNKIDMKGIEFFNMINNLSKINQKIFFKMSPLPEDDNFAFTLSCTEKDTNDGGVAELDRFSTNMSSVVKVDAENYYDVIGTDLIGLADKTIKLVNEVSFCMKSGVPLKLEYSISEDKALARIYLAPVGASK